MVCELELESTAIIRRIGQRRKTIGGGFSVVTGVMSGKRVAVVRSDAGRSKLAVATDALLAVHRPKWLIAAGFAVGIGDQVKRGEIVVATELVHDRAEVAMPEIAKRAASRDARAGRLVSVSPLPRTAEQKRQLASKTGAIAADRGSWSIAAVANDYGVPFLSIRVLIDDSAGNAEPESRAVYHPSSSYRMGGLVGALMSGSGHAGKVWKIRSAAKSHAERLAQFLGQVIPMLNVGA
jgi:nucleoside phosphorylase